MKNELKLKNESNRTIPKLSPDITLEIVEEDAPTVRQDCRFPRGLQMLGRPLLEPIAIDSLTLEV